MWVYTWGHTAHPTNRRTPSRSGPGRVPLPFADTGVSSIHRCRQRIGASRRRVDNLRNDVVRIKKGNICCLSVQKNMVVPIRKSNMFTLRSVPTQVPKVDTEIPSAGRETQRDRDKDGKKEGSGHGRTCTHRGSPPTGGRHRTPHPWGRRPHPAVTGATPGSGEGTRAVSDPSFPVRSVRGYP